MFWKILLPIIITIALAGCATTKTAKTGAEIEELQAKISDFEKQLEERDEEIRDLEEKLSKLQTLEMDGIVNAQELDLSKVTPKNIQAALKNSGFYSGAIDGRVGKKTRQAIKEFQKTNGLKPDGIVGKQTWARLQRYLE